MVCCKGIFRTGRVPIAEKGAKYRDGRMERIFGSRGTAKREEYPVVALGKGFLHLV